jgi:NADPH:quinone reductase-like Zn-dependent oxidoreductase
MRLAQALIPNPKPNQVVLQVHTAGIGRWDAYEREGFFAEMLDVPPAFPYRLGSEGSGTVVAMGGEVTRRQIGDQVYGLVGLRAPKEGFYADYVAIEEDRVWPLPTRLTMGEAGAFPSNGGTALRGLRDVLRLQAGETLLVYGASGGMGHLAVQLAKAFQVRVIAVASGSDGKAMAKSLGADVSIDGRSASAVEELQRAVPNRVDAALVTGGGDQASEVLAWMKAGSRIAVPNGVYPAPKAPLNATLAAYNADYDDNLMETLNRLSDAVDLRVHLGSLVRLDQPQLGHRLLEQHVLGRIAFNVTGSR